MSYAYPTLLEEQNRITKVIEDEVTKFNKTLVKGRKLCLKKIEELKEKNINTLDAKTVFNLYDIV